MQEALVDVIVERTVCESTSPEASRRTCGNSRFGLGKSESISVFISYYPLPQTWTNIVLANLKDNKHQLFILDCHIPSDVVIT